MKKNIFKIVLVLIILLAVGGIIYACVTLRKKENEADKHLIELKYSEFEKKIKNKDDFILVITQTNCPHCEAYKPVLKDVLTEYDITAYEINTKKLNEEENAKFREIVAFSGTPTTVFFRNGEETTTTNRLVGEQKSTNIIRRLKSLKYIK